ncbi:TPA: 5'/3'-nucleotidase SurE, partial [Neisseria meningitidis]
LWTLLAHFFKTPPQSPILWNINIPAVEPEDVRGIKIARLGRRHHGQNVIPARNPRGEQIYWIGPVGEVSDREEGTDFGECGAGFITVTPLQIDLTAYPDMAETAAFWHAD